MVQSTMRASVQTVDTPPTFAPDRDPGGAIDHVGAARVVASFQRIQGQRIVLGADDARCTVFGRRHRRTVEHPVPLSVALGLARRGVATVVRVSED